MDLGVIDAALMWRVFSFPPPSPGVSMASEAQTRHRVMSRWHIELPEGGRERGLVCHRTSQAAVILCYPPPDTAAILTLMSLFSHVVHLFFIWGGQGSCIRSALSHVTHVVLAASTEIIPALQQIRRV